MQGNKAIFCRSFPLVFSSIFSLSRFFLSSIFPEARTASISDLRLPAYRLFLLPASIRSSPSSFLDVLAGYFRGAFRYVPISVRPQCFRHFPAAARIRARASSRSAPTSGATVLSFDGVVSLCAETNFPLFTSSIAFCIFRKYVSVYGASRNTDKTVSFSGGTTRSPLGGGMSPSAIAQSGQ